MAVARGAFLAGQRAGRWPHPKKRGKS